MSDELASWDSPAYAEQWAEGDVLANLLSVPRRMSVALVAEDGLAVKRVVDLGSGPGAYLKCSWRHFRRQPVSGWMARKPCSPWPRRIWSGSAIGSASRLPI